MGALELLLILVVYHGITHAHMMHDATHLRAPDDDDVKASQRQTGLAEHGRTSCAGQGKVEDGE